jgi:hypothetical protein
VCVPKFVASARCQSQVVTRLVSCSKSTRANVTKECSRRQPNSDSSARYFTASTESVVGRLRNGCPTTTSCPTSRSRTLFTAMRRTDLTGSSNRVIHKRARVMLNLYSEKTASRIRTAGHKTANPQNHVKPTTTQIQTPDPDQFNQAPFTPPLLALHVPPNT